MWTWGPRRWCTGCWTGPPRPAGVLLVSSDFEEVADLCHRALVFVRGTVGAELAGPELTVTGLTRTASAVPAVTGPATAP